MGTPYTVIINAFLRKVELDRQYFFYNDLSDEYAMKIATDRAYAFLEEASDRVMLECMPVVDFSLMYTDNGDVDQNGAFSFDIVPQERLLLSSLMYEAYMARDISRLKTMDVNFTGTEMRVFDPSNARKTFLSMYESVKAQNAVLIDMYKNSDRATGHYNVIDFAKYDSKVGDRNAT